MKLLYLSIIILFISACDKKTTIVEKPIDIPIYAPSIEPVRTREVKFTVITKDTLDKLDSNPVWYAIPVSNYENLAYNTQELLRYIRDQKALIMYYKNLEN